jgi:parvulin-like peptidyl-prolyl isomerase
MRALTRFFAPTAALVLLLSLAGCSGGDAVVIVNGEAITETEIQTELDAVQSEFPQMFQGVDGEAREMDFRQRIIDQRITSILLDQAAEDADIDIPQSEVDAAIEEIKAGFPDEAAFLESLESVNMTYEDLERETREQLVSQKLVEEVSGQIEVSDADVEQYYENNKDQFQVEEGVRPAHILVAKEDKDLADELHQRVLDGEDFAALAEEYSIDDASAADGGDLGWPTYPFVAEFQAALDQLDVGDVSAPVESPFGWHVITVLEVREGGTLTVAEAREQIVVSIQSQRQADAFQQYVDELREEAEIEYVED